MLLTWILGFSALGSVGAVLGAAAVLALPEALRRRLVPTLIGYATGTLLGAAFLGMLPMALRGAPGGDVMRTTLGGIVFFFVLEKLVLWRHCHVKDCPEHRHTAPLLLIGDAVHNFVDGVVIATAFLSSIPVGVGVATAVIVHELPQEVGDFAILLDAGYSRRRALLLNGLSASSTLLGALLAWRWLEGTRQMVPHVLALAAASFIYIAAADLIPGLHRHTAPRSAVKQVALLLAGIATIALLHH